MKQTVDDLVKLLKEQRDEILGTTGNTTMTSGNATSGGERTSRPLPMTGGLNIIEPHMTSDITFRIDGNDVLVLGKNGEIRVNGRLLVTDEDIVQGFRDFLSTNGERVAELHEENRIAVNRRISAESRLHKAESIAAEKLLKGLRRAKDKKEMEIIKNLIHTPVDLSKPTF